MRAEIKTQYMVELTEREIELIHKGLDLLFDKAEAEKKDERMKEIRKLRNDMAVLIGVHYIG